MPNIGAPSSVNESSSYLPAIIPPQGWNMHQRWTTTRMVCAQHMIGSNIDSVTSMMNIVNNIMGIISHSISQFVEVKPTVDERS